VDDPKKSEAALRVNDPADLEDADRSSKQPAPTLEQEGISEIEEMSAEGGPELRELPMPDGVDTPDGRRKR
jgi:hypothetical protein